MEKRKVQGGMTIRVRVRGGIAGTMAGVTAS